MVRSAYTLRPEDDDYTQPGILVREVFNDAQRVQLVDQVAGSLLGALRSPVLERAFEYWKNIDREVGQRIEDKVRSGTATKPAEGMGERWSCPSRHRCRPDSSSPALRRARLGRSAAPPGVVRSQRSDGACSCRAQTNLDSSSFRTFG
jgi:hypothetical protein